MAASFCVAGRDNGTMDGRNNVPRCCPIYRTATEHRLSDDKVVSRKSIVSDQGHCLPLLHHAIPHVLTWLLLYTMVAITN
jgi:hypothetical protein